MKLSNKQRTMKNLNHQGWSHARSMQARSKMLALIQSEDKESPYMDVQLSKKCKCGQVTICKFRKELGIPYAMKRHHNYLLGFNYRGEKNASQNESDSE